MGLASSVLKVLQKVIAHKIHKENFHVSSKIRKNREIFSLAQLLSFMVYT